MKKFYLALLGLALAASAPAQTILDEDFETGNTGENPTPVAKGAGWTTVNSYTGNVTKYNWYNYYDKQTDSNGNVISTNNYASVTGSMFTSDTEGQGPREEILLTPELNLNDTYQLQFSFKVSPINSYDNTRYDLQVRVVENDNLAGAETVFSIQNQKMMRDAGITVFPITTWDSYTPRIDLSDFRGSKVKIAFVYKMLHETANSLDIDDVVVKKFTPATGPVPTLSMNRYNFGSVYVGERVYSDVLTLTNTGKDVLKVTGIDFPAGVSATFDPASVNLERYTSVDFQLCYEASMTSAASGNAVIHTNGGDVTVALSASKQLIPDGYTLETFNDYFPPAGWTSNGWTWSSRPIEGEHSALGSGDYNTTSLRSPRIDLTEGGKLIFSYYNSYDGETGPEYDINVQVSYDGGDNWVTKWTSDWQNGLNKILTAEVDLGYGDDQCYVRWMYPAVETDDYGAAEHSAFTLDRVLLPNVVGADGVPTRATVLSPANGATGVYPKDVVLTWGPAQFAKGYKVYVGTNTEVNDLVNGVDVGNALTYTVPVCDYETKYFWKIVGYNDKGDATSAPRWNFTTQPDASVTDYPYEQNFLTEEIPTGWALTRSQTYDRAWYVNSIHKYEHDGKSYGVLTSQWLDGGDSNAVMTQEFQLPADKNMCISFIWGDEHPADLVVDPTGMVQKNNVVPNNGISYNNFDIYVDGAWTTLSTISEPRNDSEKKYWINEKIDLAPYKGKKVQFRWAHYSLSNSDDGGSLTHIVIDENKSSSASFNLSSWDAGKVNYDKAINSGDIFTLHNQGADALKVKSVTFSTPNFESSIKAGDVIASGEGKQFSLQFNAGETSTKVTDNMTVEFESGYSVSLPVSGEALAKGIYYYSFEPNPLDYEWDKDFDMIDVDRGANYSFSSYWVYYSADGIRGAFSAENDSKEHGMYGMMKPVSGLWALVASSPEASNADNWIISKSVKATGHAKFDFYARNWETVNSVLPDPKHHVTVLVTEKLDNPQPADFTAVMKDTEMPFLDEGEWNHYEVDLSAYENKNIRIALRHTTTSPSNLAFFDDFTISGVDGYVEAIEDVNADMSADARVEVFNISGVKVAEGRGLSVLDTVGHGFFVVRVTDGNTVKAYRVAR